MKRINYLINFIQPCQNVIDVGSDHAYLAIKLLQRDLAKLVVNVDINSGPLQQGIANLTKHNLLHKTLNIKNDGLKNLENNESLDLIFDYLVVSGLGTHAIIDILSHNKLLIKNFILQTNKNEFLLREWIYTNNLKIIKEGYIEDKKILYPVFHVVHSSIKKHVTYKTKLLGKKSLIIDMKSYSHFLIAKQNYIENEPINAKMKHNKDLRLIVQRIKWCQRQIG